MMAGEGNHRRAMTSGFHPGAPYPAPLGSLILCSLVAFGVTSISSGSEVPRLNSRMALPSPLPTSGSFFHQR